MSRRKLEDGQPGFGLGLNTSADASQLRRQELRRADNCRLSEAGAVKKILGQQRIHAAALGGGNPIRGGFAWKRANGTTQLLVVCNGKLYTGDYSVGMAFTDRGGTLIASAIPSFAAFRDGTGECVYIADGGLLNKWDGTTLTENIAGTIAAARVWVYNRRLHGVTGTSELVSWSGLDNGDSLGNVGSGGGSAGVRTFGAQRMTTGIAVGGSSLMFHVGGISRFVGLTQDDISIAAGAQGVSGTKGTRCAQSVALIEDDQNQIDAAYFLSNRGVFRASEAGIAPVRSDSILKTLLSLDQSSWDRVQAAHHASYSEVLFYLPDVGVYAYNYVLDAWTGPWTAGFTGAITHALWEAVDDADRPIVLMGGADGFVRRVDMPGVYRADVLSNGSGGVDFAMAAQLHRLFFGNESVEKSYAWLYVTADLRGASRAGVEYATDRSRSSAALAPDASGASNDVWDEADTGQWDQPGDNWGGESVVSKVYAVPIDAQGAYLDLTLVDDSESETLFSFVRAEAYHMNRRG